MFLGCPSVSEHVRSPEGGTGGNSPQEYKIGRAPKTESKESRAHRIKLLLWTKQKPQIFISFSYEIHF